MVSAAMFTGTGWQHDVLGWVFTYLIHSSVLIAGVWALTRALPRVSLDTKETMWRVALFGGLLTSLVQAGFGLTPLPGNVDMPDAMVARASTETSTATVVAEPTETLVDKRIVEHRTGDLTITTIREATPAAAAAVQAPLQASSWPWVILGLILAGSLFAVGRLAWSARQLNQQLTGRRDVMEDPVLEFHLGLCAKAELKKRPRLSASTKLRSPVALLRNEICLPERAVDSLSPQQQQGMLAHELAHLIRKDPAWRIGIAVFEAVLFFQPLNHFARRKLNEVAEFQCDDWAARNTGGGVHLAKCLAEVASWLDGGPQNSPVMTAMAAPSSPIVQRITRLLGNRNAPTGHTAVRVAFTVLALGAVTWFVPGVGYAHPGATTREAGSVPAGPTDVRFADLSNGAYDRSSVHIDNGQERVEVRVQARKPSPPPRPPELMVPNEPRRDHDGGGLQIIIRGGIWGGGFPCFLGACGQGLFLGMELDGPGGLDGLIEQEIARGLLGVITEPPEWGMHSRDRDRARRHQERQERSAERARERAERLRGSRDERSGVLGMFRLLSDDSGNEPGHSAHGIVAL